MHADLFFKKPWQFLIQFIINWCIGRYTYVRRALHAPMFSCDRENFLKIYLKSKFKKHLFRENKSILFLNYCVIIHNITFW